MMHLCRYAISKCATCILYSMMHLCRCRYANQLMCNVHTVFWGYLDFNQCFESVEFDPIIWPDPHPTIGLSLKKKIMKLLVREFSFFVTILFLPIFADFGKVKEILACNTHLFNGLFCILTISSAFTHLDSIFGSIIAVVLFFLWYMRK